MIADPRTLPRCARRLPTSQAPLPRWTDTPLYQAAGHAQDVPVSAGTRCCAAEDAARPRRAGQSSAACIYSHHTTKRLDQRCRSQPNPAWAAAHPMPACRWAVSGLDEPADEDAGGPLVYRRQVCQRQRLAHPIRRPHSVSVTPEAQTDPDSARWYPPGGSARPWQDQHRDTASLERTD